MVKSIRSTRSAIVRYRKKVYKRIHTKVVRPFWGEAVGSSNNLVTFVDYFKGYLIVKFTKTKFDAAKAVKDRIVLLENICQKSANLLNLETEFGFGAYVLLVIKNIMTNFFLKGL